MALKKEKFLAQLEKFSKICLDSSIAIYHLEDIEPYSELTETAIAAIATGSITAVWSTISVTELLTKPFAKGQTDRVALCEQFIRSMAHAVLVAPDYTIAKEAARLRGKYGLRTPDGLLAAMALHEKADAFLTNDSQMRKLKPEGMAILVLDDYV